MAVHSVQQIALLNPSPIKNCSCYKTLPNPNIYIWILYSCMCMIIWILHSTIWMPSIIFWCPMPFLLAGSLYLVFQAKFLAALVYLSPSGMSCTVFFVLLLIFIRPSCDCIMYFVAITSFTFVAEKQTYK